MCVPRSSPEFSKNLTRKHSKKQIAQIAESIRRFGFTNPVLISDTGEILAGHGRVRAAQHIGLEIVPTVRLSHLSPSERHAYVLADNKLALNAGWDVDLLATELQGLIDLDFEIELTGFSLAKIDFALDEARERSTHEIAPEDEVPVLPVQPVSKSGDVWVLGRHRLVCGDARDPDVLSLLMSGDRADLIFTDPPYNVPIDGNVCGLGKVKHREFAFGAGEMSRPEFTSFLRQTLGPAGKVCRDGAIAFVCMDWRHMGELLEAGTEVFSELKNLCVWNKTNGGMGTFYRSCRSRHSRKPLSSPLSSPEASRSRMSGCRHHRSSTSGHPTDRRQVKPISRPLGPRASFAASLSEH